MFEDMIGKKVKANYWQWTHNEKTERFFIGILIEEDSNFIKLTGLIDSKPYIIPKNQILLVTLAGDSFD
jgi:hypothetical protein